LAHQSYFLDRNGHGGAWHTDDPNNQPVGYAGGGNPTLVSLTREVDGNPVPDPASIALFRAGLLGLVAFQKKKNFFA
jgi:hypothetical protein